MQRVRELGDPGADRGLGDLAVSEQERGRRVAGVGSVGAQDREGDPAPPRLVQPFADFINGVRKHVVTSTELEPRWQNSTRVTDPVVDHVTTMKRGPGRDIGIHGSITLTQSLLRAGLVDELRLVVAPVLAGGGRRPFPGDGDLDRLQLVGVERSAGGALFLAYGRTP